MTGHKNPLRSSKDEALPRSLALRHQGCQQLDSPSGEGENGRLCGFAINGTLSCLHVSPYTRWYHGGAYNYTHWPLLYFGVLALTFKGSHCGCHLPSCVAVPGAMPSLMLRTSVPRDVRTRASAFSYFPLFQVQTIHGQNHVVFVCFVQHTEPKQNG